jgi:energy-coupling factor transporter ATP-binding protein EcfA2
MSVEFSSLTFRYPGADGDALRNVSTAFEPGQVTLVTGALGSGCSTLLLAAAGLVPHVTGGKCTGTITTLRHDPASPEGRRVLAGRVGTLLPTPWTQLSGMSYTVGEEVAFGPANLGWSRDRIAHAVSSALDLVGAATLIARDPRTLSGGELQRVMLAAIVAMDPEVYLLDEPTLELDPVGARTVYRLLPEIAREKTVVLASTDVDRAVDVVGRVVVLDRGQVVADGSPDAVLGIPGAVASGRSTTVAELARTAGLKPPYPLSVPAAVERLAS